MTIGSFDNKEEFEVAINETKNIVDSFKTTVNGTAIMILGLIGFARLELYVLNKLYWKGRKKWI